MEEALAAEDGTVGNECNQRDVHQLKEAKPVTKLEAKKREKTKGGGDSPSDSSSSSSSSDESVEDHSRSRSGAGPRSSPRKLSNICLTPGATPLSSE